MKQAILVRYKCATDKAGSRWVASGGGTRIVSPFDYESYDRGVIEAINKLMIKIGWTGAYTVGELPNGDYAAVFKEK